MRLDACKHGGNRPDDAYFAAYALDRRGRQTPHFRFSNSASLLLGFKLLKHRGAEGTEERSLRPAAAIVAKSFRQGLQFGHFVRMFRDQIRLFGQVVLEIEKLTLGGLFVVLR